MKLMDKLKNLFLDEEEYEVEDDENFPQFEEKVNLKKDHKKSSKDELPKVMQDTIRKEEKVDLKIKPEDFIKEEKKTEENKEQLKRFNFPIDFNDEIPSRSNVHVLDETIRSDNVNNNPNVNVLKIDKQVTKKVTDLYSHREEEKIKPKFKASPVISPVYGVLDKNYTKEEVKEKSEEKLEMKRPSKKVDFETVRRKAFGNLTDEIKDNLLCEKCELYKEVKRISTLKEDDLLYDMTVDNNKDVTIEKAYDDYQEFGVAYEPRIEKRSSIYEDQEVETSEEKKETLIDYEQKEDNLVGSRVDRMDGISEEITYDNVSIDEGHEEVPSRENKKKETKVDLVDADFFELIDSMYKERVDE